MKYVIHINSIPTETVYWDKNEAIKQFYLKLFESGMNSKIELFRDVCGKKYSINDKRSILILTKTTENFSFKEEKNIIDLINYL